MASFSSDAFSVDAFSGDAFDYTSIPPVIQPNGKVIVRVSAITKGSNVNATLSGTRVNAKQGTTRVK